MSVSDRDQRIDLGDSLTADTPIIEPQKRFPEGTLYNYSAAFTPVLDRDEAIKISDGTKHVVLQGEISFTGVHGADYVQAFGFCWEHSRLRLIPLGLNHNRRLRTRKRDRQKRAFLRWKFTGNGKDAT